MVRRCTSYYISKPITAAADVDSNKDNTVRNVEETRPIHHAVSYNPGEPAEALLTLH